MPERKKSFSFILSVWTCVFGDAGWVKTGSPYISLGVYFKINIGVWYRYVMGIKSACFAL